jgi:hypothetical protein
MAKGNLKAHDFRNALCASFAKAVGYTEFVMAKSKAKAKSAMETLVDSFGDLVEDARKRMSPKEFHRAEENFDKIIDKAKARASRDGRRETA